MKAKRMMAKTIELDLSKFPRESKVKIDGKEIPFYSIEVRQTPDTLLTVKMEIPVDKVRFIGKDQIIELKELKLPKIKNEATS